MIDFRFGGFGDQPRCHLGPASVDDFGAMEADKFVEHNAKVRRGLPRTLFKTTQRQRAEANVDLCYVAERSCIGMVVGSGKGTGSATASGA